MSLLADFVAFIRDLLKPAPEDPMDPAEQLEADIRARTEWVRSHRVEEGGG